MTDAVREYREALDPDHEDVWVRRELADAAILELHLKCEATEYERDVRQARAEQLDAEVDRLRGAIAIMDGWLRGYGAKATPSELALAQHDLAARYEEAADD